MCNFRVQVLSSFMLSHICKASELLNFKTAVSACVSQMAQAIAVAPHSDSEVCSDLEITRIHFQAPLRGCTMNK